MTKGEILARDSGVAGRHVARDVILSAIGKQAATARWALTALSALFGLAMAASAPALAHPHVWVTVETEVLYDKGVITGVRHRWVFDEFYSAMAVEGLDVNHDGKVDRAELEPLAKVNVEGLKPYGYFTRISLASKLLELGEPNDYWLESVPMSAAMVANRGDDNQPGKQPPNVLALTFTLPLAQPVFADAEGLTLKIADPSFFIAFQFAAEGGIRFAKGAPAACRIVADAGESRLDALADAMQGAVTGSAPPGANPASPPPDGAAPPPAAAGSGRVSQAVGMTCRP